MRVYAIWFAMFPGDARSKWKDRLRDPRVSHLWDEKKIVGRWFAQHLHQKKTVWDAYILYSRQAHWNLESPPIASWGGPVIARSHELRRNLIRLLDTGS